jgi:hypothetical protein
MRSFGSAPVAAMGAHIDDSRLRNVGIKSMSRAIKYRDCMIQGDVNPKSERISHAGQPINNVVSVVA